MTHFLASLVDRARGTAPRVAPLIPSRFASSPPPALAENPESPMAPRAPQHSRSTDFPVRNVESETRETQATVSRDADPSEFPQLVPERFRPVPNDEPPVPQEPRRDERRSAVTPAPPTARRSTESVNSQNDDAAHEAPIVRVTIGRIEVRAAPAPATPTRRPPRVTEPTLSLDAYLKARKEGAR